MLSPRRAELDSVLVANSSAWGPGFANQGLTQQDLDDFAASIANWSPEPGYSPRSHKFVHPGRTVFGLPHGHDAIGSPARENTAFADTEFATEFWCELKPRKIATALADLFRSQGFILDQHGRPCHPWGKELASHPGIGLNPGIGDGIFWGEQARLQIVPIDREAGYVALAEPKEPTDPPSLIGGDCTTHDFGPEPHEWLAGARFIHVAGLYVGAMRILGSLRLVTVKRNFTEIVLAHRLPRPQDTWNGWSLHIALATDIVQGHSFDEDARIIWVPINQCSQILPRLSVADRAALEAALR